MKRLLVILIICCVVVTSCGPGTSEIHIFSSFDEFVEILDGRFMFPNYYPDGFEFNENTNVVYRGDYAEFGVEKQKNLFENFYSFSINICKENISYSKYYIENISIGFINNESTVYEERFYNNIKAATNIKYHNDNKIFVLETIYPIQPYDEELKQRIIYNSYILYKNETPYMIALRVIIKSLNDQVIHELLPEINEITYNEAMKMFDSLQPIE